MYCLEWCKTQNNFHVQKLIHTLAKNQDCFIADTSHDYIVIMIGTFEVCTEMADTHRKTLVDREKPFDISKTI